MLSYALKRTGLAVIITAVAIVMLISMIQIIPGDPAAVLLGPLASPSMRAHFRVEMGLDQPVIIQIARFFGRVVTGDLGTDVLTNRPVLTTVAEQLPFTLALVGMGIVWSATLGVPLGCYAAIHRGSFIDRLAGLLSVSVIAVPSFVVAIYSLLFFSVALDWFPTIGAGANGHLGDQLYHLVLPSLAIGLGWVGYLARIVRASMLEVLGENHIRMARAFGLSEATITYRYALKIAVIPTVVVLGIGIGNMISGAVFAEIVFARPGVGKLIYDSVITRNYPMVMGAVVVTTGFYVLCTLTADLIAAWLDPRVRQNL